MRTKDDMLKVVREKRQPGAYGGIPPDTRDYIFMEAIIDVRDILNEINWNMRRERTPKQKDQ